VVLTGSTMTCGTHGVSSGGGTVCTYTTVGTDSFTVASSSVPPYPFNPFMFFFGNW
jgi:hypothetical protein